jgi:hypothetical protein
VEVTMEGDVDGHRNPGDTAHDRQSAGPGTVWSAAA